MPYGLPDMKPIRQGRTASRWLLSSDHYRNSWMIQFIVTKWTTPIKRQSRVADFARLRNYALFASTAKLCYYHDLLSVYGPLRENITSPTAPEEHNILHRRTEPLPQVTRTNISWSLDWWFLKHASRQTDRHTCWSQYFATFLRWSRYELVHKRQRSCKSSMHACADRHINISRWVRVLTLTPFISWTLWFTSTSSTSSERESIEGKQNQINISSNSLCRSRIIYTIA